MKGSVIMAFLISSPIGGSIPTLAKCQRPIIERPSAATTNNLVSTIRLETLNSSFSPRDEMATRMQIRNKP
ncbi:Uncharacterised protein [Enterobacter cloacae]|nr:Uncharacterised protein [Enterobacter cloacae]